MGAISAFALHNGLVNQGPYVLDDEELHSWMEDDDPDDAICVGLMKCKKGVYYKDFSGQKNNTSTCTSCDEMQEEDGKCGESWRRGGKRDICLYIYVNTSLYIHIFRQKLRKPREVKSTWI